MAVLTIEWRISQRLIKRTEYNDLKSTYGPFYKGMLTVCMIFVLVLYSRHVLA